MKKILLFTAIVFFCLHITYGQAGQLDSSFGNKGIVLTDFDSVSVNIYGATGTKVLRAVDGTIYVILEEGNAYALVTRLLANGTVDVSYGHKGYSQVLRMVANDAAIQSDGKIVVAGSGPIDLTNHIHVALGRYNTDGTLDSTFSINFRSLIGVAASVAIQGDGKIVVVGSSFIRYNTNGTLDTTFKGVGGGSAVVIQNDGKIVVGGNSGTGFAVARYNTDGSLNSSFSSGKRTTDFEGSVGAGSLAIQKDGKIVVAGVASTGGSADFAVARYNTDGTPDTTFSDDGIQTTDFGSLDDIASSVAIQNDGKIMVIGSIVAEIIQPDPFDPNTKIYIHDFALARYNTDGTLDTTFSRDGKQTTSYAHGDDNAVSIVVQSDGKIVVAGSTIEKYDAENLDGLSETDFAVARYNTDGTLDTTFSKDGKLADYSHIGYTFFKSLAIQNDGKIVAVGDNLSSEIPSSILARYNTNGTLDTTFSHDGIVLVQSGDGEDVAIQNDGKIVVVGNFFIRYNTDGTLDTTFKGVGGGSAVVIQNDGKIVVGGNSGGDFVVTRYNTDGSLDAAFSEVGGYLRSIALQSDGKLVGTGTANTNNSSGEFGFDLVRFNTDGSLDQTFGKDGQVISNFGDDANSVAIQSDGKIIVGGDGGGGDFVVARYNTDGTPDITFSNDGKQTTDLGSYDIAHALAIQSNGKIVLGGTNEINFALARYNTNGSLDSSFGENGKQVTDASVYDINDIMISEDKLYAVGAGSDRGLVGVVARYLLDDKANTSPSVSLTTPTNNTTRLAPAAHIKLSAIASDKDGTISKVELYNGTHLLHTETVIPYGFVWRNVPFGNYTLTAKAYDNDGLVTTSAPVHISVVPNKPPVVSIINPKNNETFAASTNIQIEADAKDSDGRMTRVEFYNGSTLLNTQYQLPYRFVWKDVPAGTYTITAVARDNWGARTTSAPVTFTVKSNTTIVSSRASMNPMGKVDAASITLSPNPANTTVNLNTTGLQLDKPATIKILSASGVVMKTMHSGSLYKTIQLDVSSLIRGVYTIQLVSSDKLLYKQFVKL